ncbi:hypothetical protein [Thiococcus pfennigii]|uniref:hypothetical protein n=1 Tax=Thiococcus pfennigii TaxID=1057 RepID=UPI0019054D0F|nr:hypothetical protein [Thiococcus pfennigii]MBK1731282.1 hypothetical protein [Thiococcus pfennigii]
MKGLQRLFLGSAGGVLLFLAVEVIFLLIAWLGKVGSDLLIGLALLLHLGFAYAVLLNLLPILSLAIGGYAAGAAPQTGQNGGSGAASAVAGYIRISQGISHAVTLMILSLFLLDYQFNIATYLFVGLLLLAWGQYALVFPGSLRWPRQAAFFVLVAVSLGALAVSLSPDVAKFLTGRAFWSGEAYKQIAVAQARQEKSSARALAQSIERVSRGIEKLSQHGAVTDDVLRANTGRYGYSQDDLDAYFAGRDGKWSSLPTIASSGASQVQQGLAGDKRGVWIGGIALAVVFLLALLGGKTKATPWIAGIVILLLAGGFIAILLLNEELAIKLIDGRTPQQVAYTVAFNKTKTYTLAPGKWKIHVIPHGRAIYRYRCSDGSGATADVRYSQTGTIRVNGARDGEVFISSGNVVIGNDNVSNKNGCEVTEPVTVTIQLIPKLWQ